VALETASVHAEKRDGVLLLSLVDPGGLPRLSRTLVGAIHRQILEARAAKDILAIVITGTAKAFAVGANIAELVALTPPEAVAFAQLGQALTDEVESMSKPVIAAIRGYWKDVPLHQSEVSFRAGEIYAAGPWFATEFRCTYRRRRTGDKVDARGAIFCETKDGKIAEMRMYWHRYAGGYEESKS